MIKDGHIHTSYCPHGTNDSLERYVERAIKLGFQEISFTEHAPLPTGFIDPTPEKDSSMGIEDLPNYLEDIIRIQSLYSGKIKINVGLEVDFIEGYEEETKHFLEQYGRYLDDAILSVHFLKLGNSYECLDYSPVTFEKIIEICGSIEAVYRTYFQTVLKSIHTDLGKYKPQRIGHMTLVKKFQKKFPLQKDWTHEILEILTAVKSQNYQLDFNGAGYSKPLCGEPYPPIWIAKEAIKKGIPLIYGSDAHQVKDLGQGLTKMKI